MRWKFTLLLFVTVVLTWFGLARVSYNVDILELTPAHLNEIKGLKVLREHFSGPRELILAIETTEEEQTDLAAKALAQFLDSRPDLATPGVQWKLSLGNTGEDEAEGQPDEEAHSQGNDAAELLAWVLLNLPNEQLLSITAGMKPTASQAKIQATLDDLSHTMDPMALQLGATDPFGLTSWLKMEDAESLGGGMDFKSEDGKLRILFVRQPDEFSEGYQSAHAWLERLKPALESWKLTQDGGQNWTFHYTGEPVFMAETGMGMENDMSGSLWLPNLLIAFIFWLLIRRFYPMITLMVTVGLIFGVTLILGTSIYGDLNVMSLGFAAILMGLIVDYGAVIYQEGLLEKPNTNRQLRLLTQHSIYTGAVTTALVYMMLCLSVLPGLQQLGIFVSIGIMAGAFIMLYFFTPFALHLARNEKTKLVGMNLDCFGPLNAKRWWRWTYASIFFCIAVFAFKGFPEADFDFKNLRPKVSPANDAMELVMARMENKKDHAITFVVTGKSLQEVRERMTLARQHMQKEIDSGTIRGMSLPDFLWPNPEAQQLNRQEIESILPEIARLKEEALEAGFTEEATRMLDAVAQSWKTLLAAEPEIDGAVLPSSPATRRMLGKMTHYLDESGKPSAQMAVLGTFSPTLPENLSLLNKENRGEFYRAVANQVTLSDQGILPASWEMVSPAVLPLLKSDVWKVLFPSLVILTLILAIALKSLREVSIILVSLILGLAMLIAIMVLTGQSWNFMNACAVPLLLGMGVDYSTHNLLAIRRHREDSFSVRNGVGKALWFNGLSETIGFMSLALSDHRGLASLGLTCGIGIMLALLIGQFLVPAWILTWNQRSPKGAKYHPANSSDEEASPI